MHHFRIVLAGKNVSGASHVRSQLVNFVVPPVDYLATNQRISKISDQKIVGLHVAVFRRFQVHPPNPESLSLQPVHQVAADEAARTKDKYRFRQFNSIILFDYPTSTGHHVSQPGRNHVFRRTTKASIKNTINRGMTKKYRQNSLFGSMASSKQPFKA